jgi:threonylcarbamoyladenosine tRNA methylthiotransferase MtaB
MSEVEAVVPGHDPVELASAVVSRGKLVQLGMGRRLDQLDMEPVGASILTRREGATRGWLKVQDGCDRRCSFCATRLARGVSRSRPAEEVIREATQLAGAHPELVITGIHIGHYGRDLDEPLTLSQLLARLLDRVPDVRFRLGSIEATEVDDLLLELMAGSGGRVAPHLHMPLQSGADAVLRRMRRWHTRETYRVRALEIASEFSHLGLGADVITGFPGETASDHAETVRLVEELPFTYLHVFPYSPKDGTEAAELSDPVPQRIAGERSRELRSLVQEKGLDYRTSRSGETAWATLESEGRTALTGDYLRVAAQGPNRSNLGRLHVGRLRGSGEDLYIELDPTAPLDMDLSLRPQLSSV